MLVDRHPVGGSENWGKIAYKGWFYIRRLSRKSREKPQIWSCRRHTAIILYSFKAIPHNSKCRYGERDAADAKPKAQI